jgi:hypothetical protein
MDIKATRLLIACVIGLASCSSGSDDATNATETSTTVAVTTTTVAATVLALPYFEELAKDTRVGYQAAANMATGVAMEYAKYQNEYLQAVAFATTDGEKFDKPPLQTARLDDSGRILLESAEKRITYSDFFFVNGKLSNFKVEGRELSRNLNSGVQLFNCYSRNDGGCYSDESMDLDILHSYVSAAGDLIVTYSFRIGSNRRTSVREDRTSGGMPNHEVVDSAGTKIRATFGLETFARGETRINVVAFGPLTGGGTYTANFKFRWDGYLYEFDDIWLGNYTG